LAFIEKAVFGRLIVCFKSTFDESIFGVTTIVARVAQRGFGRKLSAVGFCISPVSIRLIRGGLGDLAGFA
jgi:hypothetical protein